MFIILLILSLTTVATPYKSYQGYSLVSIEAKTDDQLKYLLDLQYQTSINIWNGIGRNEPIDIIIPPEDFYSLNKTLTEHGFLPKITIPNIQRDLDAYEEEHVKRVKEREGLGFAFDVYHTLDEVNAYMIELSGSSELVTLNSIGKSYEGRDLNYVTITGPTDQIKPINFIDCEIHACEWITTAACLYYIDQLVSGYGNDNEITELVDGYEWIILPVLNPDGFVHSFGDDRLWRKTRHPNEGSECIGRDPNRNYANHFGGEGSSNDPCSWVYHGPEPFSESETKSHSDFLLSIKDRLNLYLAMHSAGQVWMSAWSWTESLPPDFNEIDRVATASVDAIIATHGEDWRHGSSANSYYIASGVTTDWVYEATGCAYTYTVEHRDKHSMVLPEDKIIPNAEETWNGIIAAVHAIENQTE